MTVPRFSSRGLAAAVDFPTLTVTLTLTLIQTLVLEEETAPTW